jgi:thiosulfate reductase cytochrome b subunit
VAPEVVKVHPLVVRIAHWINALAILVMITSGWKIYNASPLFDFAFPNEITLGGWLAGALQWHFAAMWLFVLNGLVYVATASSRATSAASSCRFRRSGCCATSARRCAAGSRTATSPSTTRRSARPTSR